MVTIGLGGNVLTAEITLVDGGEIAVVRVVVTGVDAASGTVAVWLTGVVATATAIGAGAVVAVAVSARGVAAVWVIVGAATAVDAGAGAVAARVVGPVCTNMGAAVVVEVMRCTLPSGCGILHI